MKATLLSLFFFKLAFSTSYAHDLSLSYDKSIKKSDVLVLESAMNEVSNFLPQSLKSKLPKNILIKISKLTDHKTIPSENCEIVKDFLLTDKKITKDIINKSFVYGSYLKMGNVLIINEAVMGELASGRSKSKRITCQHKTLYDQSIATIIHELTHAYDLNNGRISNSVEFMNKAGFKKGLLKIKNKNVKAMRSSDIYELKNTTEAFAVNMEYFLMDPEFMCRKPSMFDFYQELLGVDPYPNRNCTVSNQVMVSSQEGYAPTPLLASRIYRIDYLLASPGKGLSSGFGHSMFRIVTCAPAHLDMLTNRMIPATPFGEKCLNDKMYHLVVSYRASMDDGKLNYMKGLTGGYPSMLFILNFNDVLNEYNRDELRDIVSYPLKLSATEREEFISKVKEEHWNYRGAYKFITNNCAVESYDLLKGALESDKLQTKSSLTPNGVLKDLDELNYLSVKDGSIETYNANTAQIVLAYNKAYGYKLQQSEKANKDAVVKFVGTSTTDQRLQQFTQFTNLKVPKSDMNAELTNLKERLVIASSFSVMEQQINRTLSLKFRKKASEMILNSKDEKITTISKELREVFTINFTNFSEAGYGIPLSNEVITREDLNEKTLMTTEAMEKTEKLLKDMMPNEFAIIENISKNIQLFNVYALDIRKEFRTKLEIYIKQVIKNLSRADYTKDILIKASKGDTSSITKVRELIGKELVTDKEILDVKLIKIIKESI